ncbi:hypothetical protein BDW59DRAFT_136794 [Aspergillus cavernicola]|uniref:Copper transporter n=1 Tax=Aspergillus cavernicola TaxID=176166 RepID=A0ABR4J4D7_9EURO
MLAVAHEDQPVSGILMLDVVLFTFSFGLLFLVLSLSMRILAMGLGIISRVQGFLLNLHG